jgi:hypothetical protein
MGQYLPLAVVALLAFDHVEVKGFQHCSTRIAYGFRFLRWPVTLFPYASALDHSFHIRVPSSNHRVHVLVFGVVRAISSTTCYTFAFPITRNFFFHIFCLLEKAMADKTQLGSV